MTDCDHLLGHLVDDGSEVRLSRMRELQSGGVRPSLMEFNFCPDCGQDAKTGLVSWRRTIYGEVEREVARSREKFPGNRKMLAALDEEVGELARALLDNDPAQRRLEAVQVAATAIRIAEEGDADLDGRNEDMAEHLFFITVRWHLARRHEKGFLLCEWPYCANTRSLIGEGRVARLIEKHAEAISRYQGLVLRSEEMRDE